MIKDFLKSLLIVLGISFTFALTSCDSGAGEEGEEESTEETTDEEASAEESSEEAVPTFTANAKVDMNIEGMMCSMGCKGAIEECLNGKEGVSIAAVNFEEGTAHVEYDNTLISEDEILEAVNALNEGAYDAVKVDATEEVAEETEG
jgi:copper chaperone CopZ